MINLNSTINQYGKPKAIIDYYNQHKKIIFDFDEIMYMNSNYEIFINGKNIKGDSICIWQNYIDKWKKKSSNDEIAAIGFFSYDFKNILYPQYRFKNSMNNTTPLFWFGKPSKIIDATEYQYNYKKQIINLNKSFENI